MWECPKCHERHEDSFEVCWNCGTAQDGTEDPSFQRADDVDARGDDGRPAPPVRLACPKCRSLQVIAGVRVRDRGADFGDLEVVVYENPDALLLKGSHQGKLSATVCAQCGFTELYAANPRELWDAYQRSRAERAAGSGSFG